MHIRQAVPADAAALVELSERAFVQAFGHLYPDEDLRAFLEGPYSLQKQAAAIADPGCALFLLEDHDGTAVGYAAVGPCGLPHPDVGDGDGELKRLYLLGVAQNGGWGGRLFDAAIAWLLRDGPRPVWIGVWSENHGAQRFYARRGWVRVGEYEFPVGRVRDHEYILRRG
jgi:diamine N-acetyltransferase